MKILVDTNVILDHLLDRKPFNKAAEWIFTQTIETGAEAIVTRDIKGFSQSAIPVYSPDELMIAFKASP